MKKNNDINKSEFSDDRETIFHNSKLKETLSKITKRYYFSYYQRLLFSFIMVIILFVVSLFFLKSSIFVSKEKKLYYSESSNLDYKVYLKKNDFYETSYLGKNMSYIANLIDNINIDFNYKFNIDEKIDLNFYYNVVGVLTIADASDKNIFFEKEYNLLETREKRMINDSDFNIKESIAIDYNYYNNLANKFRTSYGVDTTSSLKIYLKINYQNKDSKISINGNTVMDVNIPLSEKSINIKLNYQDINNYEEVNEKFGVTFKNIYYIILSFISIIAFLISIYHFIHLLVILKKDNNVYDKYVKRLLLEYDRLIVEGNYLPDLNGSNVIKLDKFNELLDVRDNLKLPIMYYNVNSHHKCHFFIKKDMDVYLFTVKSVDLIEKHK